MTDHACTIQSKNCLRKSQLQLCHMLKYNKALRHLAIKLFGGLKCVGLGGQGAGTVRSM